MTPKFIGCDWRIRSFSVRSADDQLTEVAVVLQGRADTAYQEWLSHRRGEPCPITGFQNLKLRNLPEWRADSPIDELVLVYGGIPDVPPGDTVNPDEPGGEIPPGEGEGNGSFGPRVEGPLSVYTEQSREIIVSDNEGRLARVRYNVPTVRTSYAASSRVTSPQFAGRADALPDPDPNTGEISPAEANLIVPPFELVLGTHYRIGVISGISEAEEQADGTYRVSEFAEKVCLVPTPP